MIPVGYMAKRVGKKPDRYRAPHVVHIYSVSNCNCEDFADYIKYWKHNGFWFFDSPGIIRDVAKQNSISLEGTSLFYYEAHEVEFDGERWGPWLSCSSLAAELHTNSHCLFPSFDEAEKGLNDGKFENAESGPYRIFAVYSVDW